MKINRKRVKDIKRLVKLAYRKGLINPQIKYRNRFVIEADFGWSMHYEKLHGKWEHYPMFYFFSVDYWGEGDQVDIVNYLIREIEYEFCYFCEDSFEYTCEGLPNTVQKLIKFLSKQKTVNNSSHINQFLKVQFL